MGIASRSVGGGSRLHGRDPGTVHGWFIFGQDTDIEVPYPHLDPGETSRVDTLTNGSELLAEYADDRADGERVTLRCVVRKTTEHLLTLGHDPGMRGPSTGSIVDITVDGRRYRSTVQRSEPSTFTLLRPRELEDVDRRATTAGSGGLWPD